MFKSLPALLARAPEPVDYPFVDSDVAQLQRVSPAPGAVELDEQTWKDLLAGPLLERVAEGASIFGRQELYRRLRGGLDGAARAQQVARVHALLDDPAQRAALQPPLACLRSVDSEVAALLYEASPPPLPRWAGHAWLLFAALLACSAVALLWTPAGWIVALGAVALMMATQMRYHERVERWQRSLNTLQMLLRAAILMAPRAEDLAAPFAAHGGAAGALNRALSRRPGVGMVPGLREYLDWFLLDNVEHYFRTVALVARERDFLRGCYQRCAGLEADLALARYLQQQPVYCEAQAGQAHELVLDAAVHPLLAQAQPLSLGLAGKGAFISGQNGVGKSTLLRTVGINLVMARAFGFCLARRARVPQLPVYASMQGEDALLGGESLYMAELRRAQELLAAADGPHPGIYIVDEIFRGTNHLESVSAAAAVLDVLASKGLVLVSSHNLVLGPLLAHRLAPWCVEAAGGALRLRAGVLEQTNGIALLARRGLGQQVEANAARVSGWLSAYLAHPADCSHVLGALAQAHPQHG